MNIWAPLCFVGFPGDAVGKESACQCRRCKRCGSPPGSERSPGGGNGNPFQYPCLENPMDRGGYSPWGCKELKMTDQLSTHTCALLLNEFQTVFRGCFMIIHVICHCTFLCISTTWGYKEFWSIQNFMLRNRILKKTGVVDHDLSRPFATVHRPPLTQSWKICNLVLPWWLRG